VTRVPPRGDLGVSLVALDVDGTVLTPDGRIAETTRSAISAARARGVRIVLASSRGPVALARIQDELGLADEWFVGFQGALVARRTGSGLDVLAETPMLRCAAATVERQALCRGLAVGRYIGERWRVPRLTAAILREARGTGEEPVASSAAECDADAPPHKVLAIADGPTQIPLLHDLASALPPEVTGTLSHPEFLEVTAAGVDKGLGLRSLLTRLCVPAERTAAVGDGLNDLGLFSAVGSPIAMGQAGERVRAAAGWVTTSNTEDGVARALAHLGVASVTGAVAERMPPISR
jgi:Cof subfamily protein (haloacid dehalogenase superfamily)